MAKTRTPSITVLADGRRFMDKYHLGVRIGVRVGAASQEQAEARLEVEMARVKSAFARKKHARPTFSDCAARYLEQSRGKRSFDVMCGTWRCCRGISAISNHAKFTIRRTLPPRGRGRIEASTRRRGFHAPGSRIDGQPGSPRGDDHFSTIVRPGNAGDRFAFRHEHFAQAHDAASRNAEHTDVAHAGARHRDSRPIGRRCDERFGPMRSAAAGVE